MTTSPARFPQSPGARTQATRRPRTRGAGPLAAAAAATASFVLAFTAPAAAQGADAAPGAEWSRFRGPNGTGVVELGALPDAPGSHVLWRTELAPGHSSPVLSSRQVVVTAVVGKSLRTYGFDRTTGDVAWEARAPRPRAVEVDARNSPASPSPVVVDDRIAVVFFPDFGLCAYELPTGRELWRTPLGPFENTYGMGASPIAGDGLVVLACDQSRGSYVLALDAATGATVWKTERPRALSGHCTPVLVERAPGRPREVLVPGSFRMTSYALASGEPLWWFDGLSFEMKSVPCLADGIVYLNGYGSPLNQRGKTVDVGDFETVCAAQDANRNARIDRSELPRRTPAGMFFGFCDADGDGSLDATEWGLLRAALKSENGFLAVDVGSATARRRGDRTAKDLLWDYRRTVPQLPSPLAYRGVVYMLQDQGGLLVTFDSKTGEVLERGRIPDAADEFYASPTASDGKVFVLSRGGLLTVLAARPPKLPDGVTTRYEPLSQHRFGERCHATPAIGRGPGEAARMFLRTDEALYCLGLGTR